MIKRVIQIFLFKKKQTTNTIFELSILTNRLVISNLVNS